MKNYRSSIPKGAKKRAVACEEMGVEATKTELVLRGRVVGVRYYDANGKLLREVPFKNGKVHGTVYYFDEGKVHWAEPYLNGLAHGTSKQWAADGAFIGSYTMKQGTGWDLWRAMTPWSRGRIWLAEARRLQGGRWHGFEWWINDDQKTVNSERCFWEDLQHGIERQWNSDGRLRRGFPRYWIHGNRVSKRSYLRAMAKDCTLPPLAKKDDRPSRRFPKEVAAALAPPERGGSRVSRPASTPVHRPD